MSTRSTLRILTAMSLVVAKSATAVTAQTSFGDGVELTDACVDVSATAGQSTASELEAIAQCCAQYQGLDRANLQGLLDGFLNDNPDDPRVACIIALLGTPPVALNTGGGDDGDRIGNIPNEPNEPPGITTTSIPYS